MGMPSTTSEADDDAILEGLRHAGGARTTM